jgi:hypothetical protein
LALKTHTNLGCAASFATLGKLVDKFTLPPAALPIGDASLTHVIKLAAHSTTSPTPTAMRQSFIMTPYIQGVSEIGALILTGNRTRQKEQLFYLPFCRKTMFISKKKFGEIFH